MTLKSFTPEKILFVLNPVSGGKDKSTLLPQIESFCTEQGISHEVFKTTGDKDKENITKLIKSYSPQVVVAVGGDGTVNECAELLQNSNYLLGIIPLGSGNGLSKDLQIPQNDVEAALKLFVTPSYLKIDTLKANDRFFVHLCDIGFNATIVKSYSMSNRRGLLTYAYYMIKNFISYKSSRYHIVVDDKSLIKVRAFMITGANSNRFGSNITINPNGKVDDGEFELIIIKAFPYKVLPKLIWQILWKKIHFSPYSRIIKARKVNITHRRGKTLQVDGEIVGRYKSVEIVISPANLNIIVP